MRRSTQMAHVLVDRGLRVGDILAVCLRNSPEHYMVTFAGWKVGATIIPVRWDLPAWERGRVLGTMQPKLVIDADSADFFEASLAAPTTMLDEVVPPRGWGVCSSGSTGTPKVIVTTTEGVFLPKDMVNAGCRDTRARCPDPNGSWCPHPSTTPMDSQRRGTSWPATTSCCSSGSTPDGFST